VLVVLIVLGSRSASGSGPRALLPRRGRRPGLTPLEPTVEASNTLASGAAGFVVLFVLGSRRVGLGSRPFLPRRSRTPQTIRVSRALDRDLH
jgi:hypothetical protein